MKNLKEKTDSQLVTEALKNADAFEPLVNRYEEKLKRYIRRLSGLDQESIEDILQETFIKIYVNLNDYDPDYKFSSWAYRITHNEAVNFLRKNKKVITLPLETDDEEAGNLIDILKSNVDLEEELSRKDLIAKIQKGISMLPDKYREILVLRYMEDLDYREISDILRIPMGSVATLINRAKEKFRQIAEKLNLNS